MGGIGSGNYYRWNSSTTKTEETHRVDIRFLKKKGFLRPGAHGSLSWTCGGRPTGDIRFQTYNDAIHLIYKHRSYGEEWKQENERIAFDWTPCNYGGSRQWLICPHCGKRVAIVYGLDSGFLCRHCYDLPYSSQSETQLDRMYRKVRKIRRKLDNGDGYFNPDNLTESIIHKPKGMHWKTFNRLAKQEQDLDFYVDKMLDRLLNNYRL